MSDFNVSAPRLPSPVGAVSAVAITGTVPDPPRHIAGMDNGTILRGTVQGRGGDGLLTIATDHGVLKVATNANLPPGSHVTLEVRAIGDRLQVMVLSIDPPGLSPLPQTPQPQQSQTPAPHPPSVPAQASGTGAGPAPATGGGVSGNAGTGGPVKTPATSPQPTTQSSPQVEPPAKPVLVVAGQTLSAVVVQALPRDLLTLVPQSGAIAGAAVPGSPMPESAMPAPGSAAPAPSNTPSANPGAGNVAANPATRLPAEAVTGTSLIPQIRDKIEALFFGAASSALTSALAAGETAGAAKSKAGTLPPGAAMLLAQLQEDGAATPTAALTRTTPQGQPGTQSGSQPGAGMTGGAQANNALANNALATGTEVKLQVLAIQNQPGEVLDLPGLNQPGLLGGGKNTLLGQIIGQTPAGHSVIHTSLGDLVLHERMSLPAGTKILLALDLSEASLPGNATSLPLTPQSTAFNLARGWPTLADLLMTLQPGGAADGTAANPAAQALAKDLSAATAALPQAGSRLGASLAAAIDAFRNGNFEKLFGPLGIALKNSGKSDALGKLRDEFMQLSLLAQDGRGQDWRCFFLPIWDDGRLQQINLFYRRPKRGQQDDDADGNATRFVVDVNFTRLGACQLDGLVRKARFDLMVRSHRPLPETARRDIGNLFAEARALGNYAGDISFQATTRFPVSPLDEIAEAPPSVVA